MRPNIRLHIAVLSLVSGLFVSGGAPAHAQSHQAATSPVGRWVAEHPSKGGIGSWWEFRPDGTLTQFFGAMVTSAVTHTADTLTMPAATVSGPPVQVKFRIDHETLYLTANGSELTYTRVGPPPLGSDRLLGRWKPVPPKTPSADPKMAALEKAQSHALYVFSADGTESVRIPFGSREGSWNPQSLTFQFAKESVVFSFRLADSKLILGQPPDGKRTDSYVRDSIFN